MTRRRGWRLDVFAIVLGLVLVVASVVIARDGRVGDVEQKVFRAINGLPDWLRPVMTAMQYFGLLLLPVVVAIVAAIYRRWRLAIALVLVVPLKLFVEKQVLKQLVDRQRPGVTEPDVTLRGVPAHGQSFPSGHAIIAFAVAWLLFMSLPRGWRWVPIGIGGLVLIARVYLGAHNPLDVVAGAGAGLLIGAVLDALIVRPGAAQPETSATPE